MPLAPCRLDAPPLRHDHRTPESHRWRAKSERKPQTKGCSHIRPSKDPGVPHPGKVFLCGQWRTPEAAKRHQAKRYPSNDPNADRPGMVFWNGWWRTPESVEQIKVRNSTAKRNGRHRKHVGDICERCGFVPVVLAQLDVHHKDGDHSNNNPENLETICANCHRLEHAPMQRAAVFVG